MTGSTNQPNILLIHSDQHRHDCLGCNGHPLLSTPHLDRLASEGVNFRHAYTPAPICSPARASLATGLWPTQHRCINIPGTESFRPAEAGLPTIFDSLKQAGYRTGHVGKFHQELTGLPTDHGIDEFVSESDYVRWREEQGLAPRPRTNGWFGEPDPHISAEQSRLAWGAGHAVRMMEEAVAEDRPFFVRWDPSEPHLPCLPPPPFADMYPPEDIPPWPSFFDSLEGKPFVQRLQRQRWDIEGWEWSRWAPVVGRYLGEITLLDQQVGRLLDAGAAVEYGLLGRAPWCGGFAAVDLAYPYLMEVNLANPRGARRRRAGPRRRAGRAAGRRRAPPGRPARPA